MRSRRGTPIAARPVDPTEASELGARTGPRRIQSPALFSGDREVIIIHQAQEYRLRITRAEKLILTK
jgi:hemin uptake protein HemP